MGEALALASALCFGATHFLSGLSARRHHGFTVALHAQGAGLLVAVPAPAAAGTSPSPGALGWGSLSGVATGVGVGLLYRAMNSGPISTVVPVSDVTAMGVPVLAGLMVLGDRPSAPALAGIALALPAVWLVSRGAGTELAGIRPALLAGVGFAVHFLALARLPESAGLWPIAVSRAVSIAVLAPPAAAAGVPLRLPALDTVIAATAGVLGTAATTLYWLSASLQPATVAVVLAALYPAVPVLLALAFLGERCSGRQALGLAGAGGAVALIALG
ncbi:DMT family transporter [Streptomyces sp. A7024]|uniref:DMT family transporter n=1 Tax=Streptomyces coryli TaxID=1128680 RepID=A0A6G4UAZ7_9ACTN|nr:DMT family transporter [Streptomyces coryli]NGN68890.1 DMT family transporter [Streptomyces coryli]